jgi:hypothetical protein
MVERGASLYIVPRGHEDRIPNQPLEEVMKGVPLFLCGVLLACSADMFAQGTQTPRVHPRLPLAVASTTASMDNAGSDQLTTVPRGLHGKLPIKRASTLRVVVPFVGILEIEGTDKGISKRLIRMTCSPK